MDDSQVQVLCEPSFTAQNAFRPSLGFPKHRVPTELYILFLHYKTTNPIITNAQLFGQRYLGALEELIPGIKQCSRKSARKL